MTKVSSSPLEKVKEVSRRTWETVEEWVAAGSLDPETALNLRDALRYRLIEELNGSAGEEITGATRLPD